VLLGRGLPEAVQTSAKADRMAGNNDNENWEDGTHLSARGKKNNQPATGADDEK
jgi:hypothetical protein